MTDVVSNEESQLRQLLGKALTIAQKRAPVGGGPAALAETLTRVLFQLESIDNDFQKLAIVKEFQKRLEDEFGREIDAAIARVAPADDDTVRGDPPDLQVTRLVLSGANFVRVVNELLYTLDAVATGILARRKNMETESRSSGSQNPVARLVLNDMVCSRSEDELRSARSHGSHSTMSFSMLPPFDNLKVILSHLAEATSEIRLGAMQEIDKFSSNDLLSSPYWPHLLEALSRAMTDSVSAVFERTMATYERLFAVAPASQAGDLYVSVVERLNHVTDAMWPRDRCLAAASLVTGLQCKLPAVWVHMPYAILTACFNATWPLINGSTGHLSMAAAFASVDPSAQWLRSWLRTAAHRAIILSGMHTAGVYAYCLAIAEKDVTVVATKSGTGPLPLELASYARALAIIGQYIIHQEGKTLLGTTQPVGILLRAYESSGNHATRLVLEVTGHALNDLISGGRATAETVAAVVGFLKASPAGPAAAAFHESTASLILTAATTPRCRDLVPAAELVAFLQRAFTAGKELPGQSVRSVTAAVGQLSKRPSAELASLWQQTLTQAPPAHESLRAAALDGLLALAGSLAGAGDVHRAGALLECVRRALQTYEFLCQEEGDLGPIWHMMSNLACFMEGMEGLVTHGLIESIFSDFWFLLEKGQFDPMSSVYPDQHIVRRVLWHTKHVLTLVTCVPLLVAHGESELSTHDHAAQFVRRLVKLEGVEGAISDEYVLLGLRMLSLLTYNLNAGLLLDAAFQISAILTEQQASASAVVEQGTLVVDAAVVLRSQILQRLNVAMGGDETLAAVASDVAPNPGIVITQLPVSIPLRTPRAGVSPAAVAKIAGSSDFGAAFAGEIDAKSVWSILKSTLATTEMYTTSDAISNTIPESIIGAACTKMLNVARDYAAYLYPAAGLSPLDPLNAIHATPSHATGLSGDWLAATVLVAAVGAGATPADATALVASDRPVPRGWASMWPWRCGWEPTRVLAARVADMLACEAPVVFGACQRARLCVGSVTMTWLAQCFWSVLDWAQIVHLVIAGAVGGENVVAAVCVALWKHHEASLVKHVNDEEVLVDIVCAPARGFKIPWVWVNEVAARS